MTDDEINDLIIEHYATSGEVNDVVAFARAIADIEREACAKICDRFQARDVGMQPAECAGAIRARGE